MSPYEHIVKAGAEEKMNVSVLQGYFDADYMGGHVEYPSQVQTPVLIYSDKIIVDRLGLEIPYKSMTNIENIDEQRISAGRVVSLGLVFPVLAIVGAMWKKRHRYTVVQYDDRVGPRAILLDFGDKIDSAQPLIYRRMISFKKSGIKQLSRGYLLYENTKYGIRMEYPTHWVEEELDEESENYISVAQFREVVENKPPFVTIYINRLKDVKTSLQAFVDMEMGELRKDSMDINTVQFKDTVLGGKPARQLLFFENIVKGERAYKQMITWTKVEDKIYEISYSARYGQFMKYLSVVEEMIQSFQLANTNETVSNKEELPDAQSEQVTCITDDPLLILARRFAMGEITADEYQRMRKILEG